MATMLDVKQFLSNLLPLSEWDFPIILVSVVTSITAILLSTRLITGNNSVKFASGDQGSSPPTLPYWIPLLGHLPQFLYDVQSLLKEAKYVLAISLRTFYPNENLENLPPAVYFLSSWVVRPAM
jgi:hypothetical protein